MSLAAEVRDQLEPRRADMVDLLRRLVEIESPSDDRAGLDRFADALVELFGPLEEYVGPRGRNMALHVPADGQPHAVALCHYDTVWPKGTLERIPFSVDQDGVARGPGCFDMKAGIVVLHFALEAVKNQLRRPLRVLFTCDEEVGSPTSRTLIEETARNAVVAYVLESPLPGGTLKTARKGT
ncbi:MAG TPA: M20/M25/M40 family metallo-hydrolase, partial [Chloroflexota bacterium]|nr:M20/M25/M40 family metallo-hydrolase [Chloroflexota bacterium]